MDDSAEPGHDARSPGQPPERVGSTAGRDIDRILRRTTIQSPDAIAVVEAVRDPDGRLVDLTLRFGNDAYWSLTGLSPDTATGGRIRELIPSLDWSTGLIGRMVAAIESRTGIVEANVPSRPTVGPHAGQDRLYDVTLTPDGDVLAARFRDVTQAFEARRRELAEARRTGAMARFLAVAIDPTVKRTELLKVLADEVGTTLGSLASIVDQSVTGEVTLVAVGGEAAARLDPARLPVTLSISDEVRSALLTSRGILVPNITPAMRQSMANSLSTIGLPLDLAVRAKSVVAAPILSGGRPVGLIHAIRFDSEDMFTAEDLVTAEAMGSAAALVLERREAEQQRNESLDQFSALFAQAPVGLVVVDAIGGTQFNRAALDLFGREEAEMRELGARQDSPWIPDDDRERWAAMRAAVVAGQPSSGVRFGLLRPSGERREVLSSAIPMAGTSGSAAGVITVLIDVTEREAIAEQLRHAQKMEALGRLAGGIAHDFNNVLMAIRGFAELIAEDARAGSVDIRDADVLLAASVRAIDLTNRLTTFARRDMTRREPLELTSAVASLLPLIERLAPENVAIDTQLRGTERALLDRSEFEQLVVNLVVNAVDAMPDGGRLTIETDLVDLTEQHASTHLGGRTGPHIQLAVSDTGIGMDEATKARIFEPFYTTKPAGVGTGLGLAMVFAAVERAEGGIFVYSEPGRGTTFKIYLPVTSESAGPADEASPAAAPPRGTESILLVEDDPLVRGLVERLLDSLGYGVTSASLPSEAIALATVRPYDLVVSDMVMPEMPGDVLAIRLREQQPGLPFLFMSGYTARALAFEPGAREALLHKPIARADLAVAIRSLLDVP